MWVVDQQVEHAGSSSGSARSHQCRAGVSLRGRLGRSRVCTLIAAFQQHALFPVIVAANRDELYARASSGPRAWERGFFAPRDEAAGGTWLGVTSSGAFVGVTNRFGAPKDGS